MDYNEKALKGNLPTTRLYQHPCRHEILQLSKKKKRKIQFVNWLLSVAVISVLTAVGCRRDDSNIRERDSQMGLVDHQAQFAGRIVGDSMAPVLKGSHWIATCPRCDYRFEYAIQLPSQPTEVFCPLCGQKSNHETDAEPEPADRIKIESLKEGRSPGYWDVVAYRHKNQVLVKRIVGLPTDRVLIQNGDVIVNQSPLLKPPGLELETRIKIFDSRNWIDRQLLIEPELKPNVFPVSLAVGRTLKFVNYANYDSLWGSRREAIKDFAGYNQNISRSLNLCHDIGCEFSISRMEPVENPPCSIDLLLGSNLYGMVKFAFHVGRDDLSVVISQNGRDIKKKHWVTRQQSFSVYASLIDGNARVLLGRDGDFFDSDQNLVHPTALVLLTRNRTADLDSSADRKQRFGDKQVTTTSPSTGAYHEIRWEGHRSEQWVLSRMQIFRDIHYFEKVNQESHVLKKDEFFVVGDNVPVSRDSRDHGYYPKRSEIIGKIQK